MTAQPLSSRYSQWPALSADRASWQHRSLSEQFEADSNRGLRLRVAAAGLELDYSKNHLTDNTLKHLLALAREAQLPQAIKQLFNGGMVNPTEQRPALHTALRHSGTPCSEEQQAVASTLARMADLVAAVHSGQWLGYTGQTLTDVINIGIGGSDLGPRMVTKALTPFHTGHVRVHFVANIDGAELSDLLAQLNPARSLFIVASKSFSTQETLENALSARAWLLAAGASHSQLAQHFVAISSRVDKAVQFGIAAQNVYPIWDWVGGRYSLWSAIGLPIAFAVGMDHFNQLRAGAGALDTHFETAPLEKNLPVLLGLIQFWYSQFFNASTQAVLPYAYHLQLLPNYLQQLEMESNGKSVNLQGQPLPYPTGSIVWGTEGTNGQHSFHQLLHQGTHFIPVDFIAILRGHSPLTHQHRLLFANCVAQSQALMTGRNLAHTQSELRAQGLNEDTLNHLAPHKVHPGSRPSNTLILEQLTPYTLGALIAAYEHKVYTLAVLLNINPFDQWGVELGKLLGTHIQTALETQDVPGDWDSSTAELLRLFGQANG